MLKQKIQIAAISVMALVWVSCDMPGDDDGASSSGILHQTFTAYTESFTKAELQGSSVLWTKGDQISIFSKGKNQRFSLTEISSDGMTGFFEGSGYADDVYYAVSPYAVSHNVKSGVFELELKESQSAVENGFDPKAHISVAMSQDDQLEFSNVTSLVALTVGNDNVRSIRLRSKDEKGGLAGKAQVSFSGSNQSIKVLNSKSVVTLSGNIRKGNRYYISVYPGDYSSLEVVYEFAGSTGVYPIGKAVSLKRNTIHDLGAVKTEEPEPASQWAALADSCNFVLIENFMNKNKGTFWGTPQNASGNSSNLYWQQAHAIDVIVYAYERLKDSNESLASAYLSYIRKWYDNDANNYNNSRDSEGEYGGFFNQYTDDMCWICLTLLHMTEATGDEKYAETAMNVFDKYIMPRAITDEKGTALPWTNIDGKMGKNACTNAPGCLVAAKLYRKYGQKVHLDNAMTLYTHVASNLLKSDGRVEEPPLTYTQGTFGEACRQLFHITGERSYMDMAAKVLVYGMTNGRCTNATTGVLRSEGTSMDQSIFKSVLIPYAVNFVLDEEGDKPSRDTVRERLLLNAETLRKNLDHSRYPQMYANYYWGKPFTEDVASMGAQTSGASLIENVTRMDMNLTK